jgi:hypothetical protein
MVRAGLEVLNDAVRFSAHVAKSPSDVGEVRAKVGRREKHNPLHRPRQLPIPVEPLSAQLIIHNQLTIFIKTTQGSNNMESLAKEGYFWSNVREAKTCLIIMLKNKLVNFFLNIYKSWDMRQIHNFSLIISGATRTLSSFINSLP